MRILAVFGTRPEAIKLAPVARVLKATPGVNFASCATAQHREMLDQVLSAFGLEPEYDLDVMTPDQSLDELTAKVLAGAGAVVDRFRPDWVLVQGDTTTTFAGALAAFYRKVKLAHVEAGLRTGEAYSPWPEEMNRRLVGQLTTLHFPPTERAAANLRREGVPERDLCVTGNTVIDALLWVVDKLEREPAVGAAIAGRFRQLDPAKRLILVTGHRRESFGGGLARVCEALLALARRGDVEIVYPVHLNPTVQRTARSVLSAEPAIHLLEPQEYLPFVWLMRRAALILTDSGGIQEEAPALGVPVLITRENTERPEAFEAGTAALVGTDAARIQAAAERLLDDPAAHAEMARAENPFGDGKAAERIRDRLLSY